MRQSGIIAGVATKVAELGLNIDDISQTVLDSAGGLSSEGKQILHLRAGGSAGESLNIKINIH